MGIILKRQEIGEWTQKQHDLCKKIVFTNGCFDIIHPAHVRLLNLAKAEGDILIVGINSDNSVRKLKGIRRPIIPEKERAEILSAMDSVDAVIIFEDDTPLSILLLIKPDVLVKGGDWEKRGIVGKKEVQSWGGKVLVFPTISGYSTTVFIKKMAGE